MKKLPEGEEIEKFVKVPAWAIWNELFDWCFECGKNFSEDEEIIKAVTNRDVVWFLCTECWKQWSIKWASAK